MLSAARQEQTTFCMFMPAIILSLTPGDGLQQPVAESLMISLAVIMAEVLCNRAPKRFPSKEDHPTQALNLPSSA